MGGKSHHLESALRAVGFTCVQTFGTGCAVVAANTVRTTIRPAPSGGPAGGIP